MLAAARRCRVAAVASRAFAGALDFRWPRREPETAPEEEASWRRPLHDNPPRSPIATFDEVIQGVMMPDASRVCIPRCDDKRTVRNRHYCEVPRCPPTSR